MSDCLVESSESSTSLMIYNRESLALELDTSLSALRGIRVLERLLQSRGKPSVIGVDNGPDFISDKPKKIFSFF